MYGIGGAELLILIVIAVLLFGAPVVTFLAGYTLGRKKSESPQPESAQLAQPEQPSEERSADE